MTLPKLLAMTADVNVLRQLNAFLGNTYSLVHARTGDSVATALRADRLISVLVVDHAPNSPMAAAINPLEAALEHRPDVRRGLITDYGQPGPVIRALHAGSIQFMLQRPLAQAEVLACLVASRAAIAAANTGLHAAG